MNERVTISMAARLILVVVIIAAGLALADDNQYSDLERAYIEGKLKIQDVVAAKDSVYGVINDMYQPVKPILQNSCFDCHSQYTDFPWYHSLPLVKGMIDDDISEAREHLDMSNDFPFSGKESSLKLLEEIKEEIEKGDMPPLSYRFMHWGKLIEDKKRDSLFTWIDSTTALLTAFYDSLLLQASDSSQ